MVIEHTDIMETLEGLRIESYSLERVKDGSILISIKCWNKASRGSKQGTKK
jgi:hypothetical protein